jgi:hypothetical protein
MMYCSFSQVQYSVYIHNIDEAQYAYEFYTPPHNILISVGPIDIDYSSYPSADPQMQSNA